MLGCFLWFYHVFMAKISYVPTKLDDFSGKCWDSYSSTMVKPYGIATAVSRLRSFVAACGIRGFRRIRVLVATVGRYQESERTTMVDLKNIMKYPWYTLSSYVLFINYHDLSHDFKPEYLRISQNPQLDFYHEISHVSSIVCYKDVTLRHDPLHESGKGPVTSVTYPFTSSVTYRTWAECQPRIDNPWAVQFNRLCTHNIPQNLL